MTSSPTAFRGLLDREDLVQTLDRALTKRVTVVSAPPGSGKTSLLLSVDVSECFHRRETRTAPCEMMPK